MSAFRALLAATTLLAAANAQCPHLEAKRVPANWQMGPAVGCSGGINLNVGGVQVKTGNNVCPLFVVITPTHDVAKRTTDETRVESVRQVAEQIAFFSCVTDWFLFIPIDSSCVLDRIANLGTLDQLRTLPCD